MSPRTASSLRHDGRKPGELRPVVIKRRASKFPAGAVLVRAGLTRVLCTACIEQGVPDWLDGSSRGWITAEYGMLPSSTPTRKRRNVGKVDGRAQEIQRLIGRCLRAVTNLERLPGLTIWIDCDVLQADGGTRAASITGAFVALSDAVRTAMRQNLIRRDPLHDIVAAVSVGVAAGQVILDLDYHEDSAAEVDMNVAMTGKGKLVEVQGSAEAAPFTAAQLQRMLAMAKRGIRQLHTLQRQALARR